MIRRRLQPCTLSYHGMFLSARATTESNVNKVWLSFYIVIFKLLLLLQGLLLLDDQPILVFNPPHHVMCVLYLGYSYPLFLPFEFHLKFYTFIITSSKEGESGLCWGIVPKSVSAFLVPMVGALSIQKSTLSLFVCIELILLLFPVLFYEYCFSRQYWCKTWSQWCSQLYFLCYQGNSS